MKRLRVWPLLLVVGAACASSGCTNLRLAFTYQDEARDGCRRKHTRHVRVAPRVRGPAHRDWRELRAHRSYHRVGQITEFAHYFTVRLHCIEDYTLRYLVDRDPKTGKLRVLYNSRNLRRTRPTPTAADTPTPKALAHVERAVRKTVAKSYKGESKVRVSYEGSYRMVRIDEIVALSGPGDPDKRRVWRAHIYLPTNAELTAVVGPPVGWSSARTVMCSRYGAGHCTEPPRWIDFDQPTASTTTRLAAMTHSGSPIPASTRRVFLAKALQAARAHTAKRPHRPIEALAVHKRAAVSFEGLQQTQAIGFRIAARPIDRAGRYVSGNLDVEVPVKDMVFGTGTGAGTVTVADVTFRATVRVTNKKPPAADANGPVRLALDLSITLDDGRGNKHELAAPLEGEFLVQDGAAAGVSLRVSRTAGAQLWRTLRRKAFPGNETHRHFYASLRIEPQPRRWHPKRR